MTALPASDSAATYVDASSEFSGTLKIAKSLHIDGAVEGEIECAATVTIGSSGRVTARVRAESVVIDGEIHGDIEARSEIMLSKSARVYGDLMTEGIVIERGAKVEGRITIGPIAGSSRPSASVTSTPENPVAVPPQLD
jgi:cytoskeletal protein CcmA (bactofilin family)